MKTSLKIMNYSAAIALVMLLHSCGTADRKDRDDSANHIIDSIGDTTERAQAQTADVALNGDEKTFVLAAANGGMMEVEAANIALQQSVDPAIKAFAKMMIADHTKANLELTGIAEAVGMQLPSTLADDKAQHLAGLKKLKDKKFDEQYITMMLADHALTVQLLTEGKALSNPQLKAFSLKTLPVVTAHYNEAVKIGKSLNLSNTGNGDDLQGLSPTEGSTN